MRDILKELSIIELQLNPVDVDQSFDRGQAPCIEFYASDCNKE